MFRRCSMSRRCLWLAVPMVAGHLGCLALPAATLALGVPVLMPICGQEPTRFERMAQWVRAFSAAPTASPAAPA